jgi:hypothetical protein
MERENTVNIEASLENRQQLCRILMKDQIETIVSMTGLLKESKN